MKPLPCMIALGGLWLAACDPITMGLVTASGGVAVNHQMAATATRTFSETAQGVQLAVLAALQRMSMVVGKQEQRGEVKVIQATAGTRSVTLRLEPVTRTSTLLEVSVHQDLLTMDGATAREIVAQTEHALGLSPTVLNGANATYPLPETSARADSATDNGSLPGRTTYYGRDSDATGKEDSKTHAARASRAGHPLPTVAGT